MTLVPCKVAVIGAGAMARQHIRAFADVPGVVMAGIHSRTRAKAEALAAEFGIGVVCDSVAELYDRTRADLVVVTVSELAMKTVGLACLRYPWALLLEKPPGLTPMETRELLAARAERVYVGLNRRFYSVTRAALHDLSGLASPRLIQVQDQQSMADARRQGFPEIVVQNWMYKNSIHLVDYLLTFGRGEIVSVKPILPWRSERTRWLLAKVEFSSGDIGLYEGIWDGPGPWAVSVSTPERRWELRPLEAATLQQRGERQRQPTAVNAWDTEFKTGFRLQAEQAVAAVRNEPSTIPTLAEALRTMLLVEAIFSEIE